jgi:hypothetical protein
MKSSTTVAAGVGVVVGLGVVVLGFGLGFTPDSSFSLKKDPATGACKPSEPPPMSAAWGKQVTWEVTNVDCDPQYVTLKNFKHPKDGGGYDDAEKVLKDDPLTDGPVSIGTPMKLKSKVDKFFVWKKSFKYEIWNGISAGGVTPGRDPDIDIWP